MMSFYILIVVMFLFLIDHFQCNVIESLVYTWDNKVPTVIN